MINNNNNCEDGWTKSSKVVRQSIAEQCSSNNSNNEPHATLAKVEIVIIVLKVVTYMQLFQSSGRQSQKIFTKSSKTDVFIINTNEM